MGSLTPFNPNIKPQNSFKRRGITMHPDNPAAGSIGALTPSQQEKEANKSAIETDPVLGEGATPQNRIARYGTGGFNGQ